MQEKNLAFNLELSRLTDLEKKHSDCIDISSVPKEPNDRYCAVLVLDLTKSTWVIANMDHQKRGNLISRYIMEMKRIIENYNGRFISFTGDGLIAFFGVVDSTKLTDELKKGICFDARNCSSEIVIGTKKFFANTDDKKILEHDGLPTPQCCIVLAAGQIAFGRFGGSGSGVGMPIIQAVRVLEQRGRFGTL